MLKYQLYIPRIKRINSLNLVRIAVDNKKLNEILLLNEFRIMRKYICHCKLILNMLLCFGRDIGCFFFWFPKRRTHGKPISTFDETKRSNPYLIQKVSCYSNFHFKHNYICNCILYQNIKQLLLGMCSQA